MKKPPKYPPILSRDLLNSIRKGNLILENEMKGKSLNKSSMEKIINSLKRKLINIRKKGIDTPPIYLQNVGYIKAEDYEIAIYLAEEKHFNYLHKYESYKNEI